MTLSPGAGEDGTGSPLYFAAPAALREIDLEERPDQRAERTYQQLLKSCAGLTDEQCGYVVYSGEEMIARLISEGAVYVANCIARSSSDPAALSMAQFTILVKKSELHADDPLAAVAGGLRIPGSTREVAFAEFPVGKALLVGEEIEVQQPTTVDGREQQYTSRVRQAQAILPFPDRSKLAIFAVSSQCLDDWGDYVGMLDDIMNSVSFTKPTDAGPSAVMAALG